MLSAIIMALLSSVMLLIVTTLIISVLREHQHRTQAFATQVSPSSHSRLNQPVTMMLLPMQQGMAIGFERPQPVPTFTLSSAWYTRRRTLVSLSFLLMLLLTLFVQSGLADGALQSLGQSISLLGFNQQATEYQTSAHGLPGTASSRIERIDSAARDQYYTDNQFWVWSFASCSGIAMEEVMNAYGRHLIAADVLQVEQNMGIWDTYNGLTGGERGIAQAASYFGFKAAPNPPRTLQDLQNVTNKGLPVIVGVPGHILVVSSVDNNYVYLVDSAPANRKIMTRNDFLSWWNTFSVVLTPR